MASRFQGVTRVKGRIVGLETFMRPPAPYGLEIIESCVKCPHREERLFCNLPEAGVKRLAGITSSASYPRGATLFVEGQAPRGVFILCNGQVKLSTTSADGKTLILRIAEPGEVLGLSATVTGKPYELTADVVEPSQANFISRAEFLSFLREHGDAALRVAQQLGETYQSAIAEMRNIGLSHSASEKLARFLLELPAGETNGKDGIRVKLTLTHEEIAQMIGASRETVTRMFADFKKKQILEVKGSTLIIKNKAKLASIARE
ncbi:MAG TPA: Crp/Fnr family transcriptional regulator [Candidatus Dormibacteraeota bacterium]|nr:Crp/Fnr family transcriptional regulator [Candidatus Dormibacteraeota bacterium]